MPNQNASGYAMMLKSYEVQQLVNHTGHVLGVILAIYAPIMIYTTPVRNDFWCV